MDNRAKRLIKEIDKIQTEYDNLQAQMGTVSVVHRPNSPVYKRLKDSTDRQAEYVLQKANDIIRAVIQEGGTIMVSPDVDLERMEFNPETATPITVEYNGEKYNFLGLATDAGVDIAYIADYSDNTVMIYQLNEFDEEVAVKLLPLCSIWIAANSMGDSSHEANVMDVSDVS